MEEEFYKARLTEKFGIEVVIPSPASCNRVSTIIYDELCLGVISDESREFYLQQIADLSSRGAQAVILGCTEIALLVQQSHTEVPLYDTTAIHAEAAIKMALTESIAYNGAFQVTPTGCKHSIMDGLILETFTVGLATFFATIGPLDVAAVFAALTADEAPKHRRRMAVRGSAYRHRDFDHVSHSSASHFCLHSASQ